MSDRRVGRALEDLATPLICVDMELLRDNVRAIATACRRAGKSWRPHVKCHGCPDIARLCVEAGAVGVTCARLKEVEAMFGAGVPEALLANYIVDPAKMARLVELHRLGRLITCVDHVAQIDALARVFLAAGQRLDVVVELDVGMRRCGAHDLSAALELARKVASCPSLHLVGVMGYEGHLLTIAEPAEKRQAIFQALDRLVRCRDAFVEAGRPCPIVSCGGTGSYQLSILVPGITEVQAGGGVLMDSFYQQRCGVTDLQQAVTVWTTVTGRPASDRAIVDAGRKTLDSQIYPPTVVGCPGVEVDYLSAEHGVLRIAEGGTDLQVGQRIRLRPGYLDFTTALHRQCLAVRNGRVADVLALLGRD